MLIEYLALQSLGGTLVFIDARKLLITVTTALTAEQLIGFKAQKHTTMTYRFMVNCTVIEAFFTYGLTMATRTPG